MARRTQRSFGAELNKKIKEEELQELENEELDPIIAPEGVEAKFWQHLGAYAIDAALSIAVMALFLFFGASVAETKTMEFMYALSNILTQVWFFVLWPIEYSKGQTIGKKMFGVYTRDVMTKKNLPWWKGLLRDFGYGVFAILISLPLEIIFVLYQVIATDKPKDDSLQSFTLFGKNVIFARDYIFKTETVFLPKEFRPVKEKKNKK